MDGIMLLERARTAGLNVQVVNGLLKIKGPRAADSLARVLIANKAEVMAALAPAPPPICDYHNAGDGDETRESSSFTGVSSPAPDTIPAQADCGSLHIQPQHWVHRDGRAYCTGCGRFMGYVRAG
jgi:hypothetical protein